MRWDRLFTLIIKFSSTRVASLRSALHTDVKENARMACEIDKLFNETRYSILQCKTKFTLNNDLLEALRREWLSHHHLSRCQRRFPRIDIACFQGAFLLMGAIDRHKSDQQALDQPILEVLWYHFVILGPPDSRFRCIARAHRKLICIYHRLCKRSVTRVSSNWATLIDYAASRAMGYFLPLRCTNACLVPRSLGLAFEYIAYLWLHSLFSGLTYPSYRCLHSLGAWVVDLALVVLEQYLRCFVR